MGWSRASYELGPLGAVLEQRFEFFGFPPDSRHIGSVTTYKYLIFFMKHCFILKQEHSISKEADLNAKRAHKGLV